MDIDDKLISSVVIVMVPQGYIAHLRFVDSTLDEDISAVSKESLYSRVEASVYRKLTGEVLYRSDPSRFGELVDLGPKHTFTLTLSRDRSEERVNQILQRRGGRKVWQF